TPVPELVLEALRALKKRPDSMLGGVLLNSLGNNRKKLELPLKAFNLFRKTGVYSLLSALGVFRLAGHSWLGRFNQAGFPARLRFMDELVEDSPVVVKSEDLPAACYYFSACSTNYFYPGTGLSTLELLNAFVGPVRPLGNGCCGQAAYSRGLLSDARAAARAVISRMETLDSQLPVITECPSCAAFLKNLEQLFLEDPQWRRKAAAFAVNVKHISEVISPDKFRAKLRVKKQVVAPASKPVKYPRPFEEMRVTFNDACVASHRLGLLSAPRKLLEHYFGARYTEMPESEICCGGADGYALFQPRLARELGRRKAANAAKVQADVIVVSSPVCVAQ
ncbi:MAG TPA: (Fe-S)-binding protein, partial [Elusimicrobiales bacterium]|nr:(Fe-S)-binding protein [Elusimicrobiales bacterium]